MTHSVVVGHRPWQRTLRQELNTCYREGVHVDLLGEITQAGHQFRGLPTQRSVYVADGSETMKRRPSWESTYEGGACR